MEGALGVIQSTYRHFSHVETLKASKGTTLNSKSHQKQGAKAPRNPQRAKEAGATGLLGDKGAHGQCSQEGFLEEGMGTKLGVKEQGHIWASPKQRGGAIAYKAPYRGSPRVMMWVGTPPGPGPLTVASTHSQLPPPPLLPLVCLSSLGQSLSFLRCVVSFSDLGQGARGARGWGSPPWICAVGPVSLGLSTSSVSLPQSRAGLWVDWTVCQLLGLFLQVSLSLCF